MTMDGDGKLTQIPSAWAGRVVRVSIMIETQELASAEFLVCGGTAGECYGRLITGENGGPAVLKTFVKDWSEGLAQGDLLSSPGYNVEWTRLWNGLDEKGQPLPPKALPEGNMGVKKGSSGAKKGHRLQLSGDVIREIE